MRPRYVSMLLAVVALVAGACGGGVEAGDDGTIEIVLSEFEFSPSDIVLHPGETVTIVLDNQGEKEHEFMAGRDVRFDGSIPDGFEHDFFETVTDVSVEPEGALEGMEGMAMDEDMADMEEGDGMEGMEEDEHAGHGFMVMREPATQASITFTVTEESIGEWEIGCFEEDGAHWDDGMRGTIVVEEA